ncbi:MAG: glycoside hydrolase, partial [Myxococcota bacterium]|nr:glycoside hydrolase [Myxococcota bacterium]
CNGADDDCDGAIDDGLTPPARATVPSCAETRGVCGLRTPTCRGAAAWGCDLPATHQAVETRCDLLDNDCDGTVDEGCLRPTGTDVRLDTQGAASSANSLDPRILGIGSRLNVVWRDLTGGGNARIYATRSTDSGSAWATPSRLDGSSGPTFRPDLALAGASGVVWSWPDFRGGVNYREIYSRRSTDGGATLQGEVKINASGTTSTRDSYNARLASVGTNVYAVYESFAGTRSRHIFFSRSTDSGATWSTPLQLSTPTGATFVAADPRIAATGTSVYVVWRDNRSGSLDLQLRRSVDSGATFAATEQRIDTGSAAGASASFSPDIAANGTGVWVVWVDDRDMGSFDIWANRSSDSGATWLGSAVKLDGDPLPHDSIEPHVIAPSAANVIVSWIDYRSGFSDVYATRSTSGGASWSAPERLDTGSAAGATGSFDVDLGGSGSLIAAVWADDRAGAFDIFANFSLDGGATWQPQDYRLDSSSAGSSDSRRPSVWVGSGAFHVVWVDHRRGASCPITTGASCPNGDIFYRRVQ